jgi:hypothetical protein
MLLAELNARVVRRLRVDEPAVAVGWHLGGEGRVHEAGTALFDEHGELCALRPGAVDRAAARSAGRLAAATRDA